MTRKNLKRRRVCAVVGVKSLEELLIIQWISHHDATHGGKVPLSDNMLLEQVSVVHNTVCMTYIMSHFNELCIMMYAGQINC